MDEATYRAAQDRVELLSRLLIATDPKVFDAFIAASEHADTFAPYVDPTAWIAGHGKLRMAIEHAKALATARRKIVQAAKDAGEPVPV